MNRDVKQSLYEEQQKPPRGRWKQRLSHAYQRSTRWGQRLPPGLRAVLGVLFLVGGTLGFLPILGFWMIPLGISLLALDFLLLRRRLDRWLGRTGRSQEETATAVSEKREARNHPPHVDHRK